MIVNATCFCDQITATSQASGMLSQGDHIYCLVASPHFNNGQAFRRPGANAYWVLPSGGSLPISLVNADLAADSYLDLIISFIEDHGEGMAFATGALSLLTSLVAEVPYVGKVLQSVANEFAPSGYFKRQSLGIFGLTVASDAHGVISYHASASQNAAVVTAPTGQNFQANLTGDGASYRIIG